MGKKNRKNGKIIASERLENKRNLSNPQWFICIR